MDKTSCVFLPSCKPYEVEKLELLRGGLKVCCGRSGQVLPLAVGCMQEMMRFMLSQAVVRGPVTAVFSPCSLLRRGWVEEKVLLKLL